MRRVIITIFFLLSVFAAMAEGDPCRKSTEGTDFWFGFLEGRWDGGSGKHFLEITITARETTQFNITIGPNETPFQNNTFTVIGNNSIRIKIPWELVEPIGSEIIEDKGIHLVSEKPVNVYALNYDKNSADVAVVYPVQSLGTEYFAICYTPDVNGTTGRNSEFMVVATENSTTIEITPSKVTDKEQPRDSTFVVTLNKGQIYQVQSENIENKEGQGDLTGSFVNSDKPVAFYSGSHGTRIPTGKCCWDHLYEQIPPVHSWGLEYFAVPLKSREQDRYRIIAAKDNTTVYITGEYPITLNRGQFKEFVFYYNDPKRILADKPIMVAQYSQSKDVDKDFTGGNGDPFMIILSSTTQSKNDVTFVAYESSQIKKYFVNIISLTSEIGNVRFDGQSIQNEFHPFVEKEYSYAQKEIKGGTHHIENLNKDRGFLAYVYGYGGVESYGYGVGFNLDLVLDLGKSINFTGDTLSLCYGDSRTLDAGPYFDTYNWNTGDSTQTLTVTKGGKYSVTTTTVDGCILKDSIYIYISHPVTDLGVEYDDGCAPYSIDLDANSGFVKYIWQNQNDDTLSTSQTITLDKTGEYRVTVYDQYNCPARDTMNLVVFPVPKIKISGSKLICGSKSSQLSVNITGAPISEWNYDGSFSWSTDKPTQLSFSNEKHTSANIAVTGWGKYKIYYHLTTINGCESVDSFQVAFHQIPTSNFEFVEDPNDKCKGYSREILYTGNASQNANFYWDYGGSKVIDSLSWNNFIVSLGSFNSKPYLQLNIEEDGCWSDTTRSFLGANPDFKLETGKARGCDSMTVLFKGKLNVPDSLLFEWDFGDGSPVSHLQNTKHFYEKAGFYDVSLSITNVLSGCEIGFQIDSMIKIFPTPTAAITADPSSCYPDSAQIFYTHNIDSSYCDWQFDGMHQSGTGNDSITVIIDQPAGTVTLTVDEYGCVSDPFEMQLKRKPHFDFFTENEEGCQPYTLEIFGDPFDSLLNFSWIPDSLPNVDAPSNIYTFQDSGKFDVTLKATSSETGCSDTHKKTSWIWVHPKPISNFEVDYPVALLEHAEISFTNLSEFANVYQWDFGDEGISFEENPKHTFTALGEFTSQLFVKSQYGCRDTSDFLIKILPFSVFTPNAFRPNSEIAENRTYMPVGVGADLSRFYLKIYDRWGQIIFETKTPEHPWDGTTPNGEPAPMGNYIWISHYFDIQGYEHNQKGQVLLIR